MRLLVTEKKRDVLVAYARLFEPHYIMQIEHIPLYGRVINKSVTDLTRYTRCCPRSVITIAIESETSIVTKVIERASFANSTSTYTYGPG